jgi:microcystin-dependent protein
MLKRLFVAFAVFFVLSAAHAAGTVPGFSLTPQFDSFGKVMPGCKLYIYQAGTVATPQAAYQDTALSILQPNPILCDASGRLPQWFVADGLIKLRLTDKSQTQVFVGDNLLVVGPSAGGGGGGGTVDPTTIFSTGMTMSQYGSGAVTGWVRMNGRTIGSATSGATERANSDTNALFVFLWNGDANLTVSGGRGASPAADWAANKTIALPDLRGRTLAGLDDMGGTDSSRLASSSLTSCRLTLGCAGGESVHTLATSEIPNGLTVSSNGSAPVSGSVTGSIIAPSGGGPGLSNTTVQVSAGATAASISGTASIAGLAGVVTNSGNQPHNVVQPTLLTTFYIKL